MRRLNPTVEHAKKDAHGPEQVPDVLGHLAESHAHGTMNTTSMSKMMNSMATR